MSDPRAYPDRPYLAVSAAIIRDGRVLVAQRDKAGSASRGLFTLPGGVVEAGETLFEAARREVQEETSLDIEPVALAGHREVIVREVAEETEIAIEPVALAGHREFIQRDAQGRVQRHFVILCFAARWLSGEGRPNEELAELRWLRPAEIDGLRTTEGLADIVAAAFKRMEAD